jgi:hypothetical protein
MDAEPVIIGKFQFRAPDYFRMTEVRLVAGSFGTIEPGLGMDPVAERSVLGMTAPAQGTLLLYGIPVNDLPGPAVPFIIVAYLRNNNGDPAGHEVRAVFRYRDLHGIAFRFPGLWWLFCHGSIFTIRN